MLRATVTPYTLRFAFTAHTSRETFTEKQTFYIRVFDDANPDIYGVGEVAVFPSLQPSFTTMDDFRKELDIVASNIDSYAAGHELPCNSAIRFGIETALSDLNHGGKGLMYEKQELERLNRGIRINGLVWMNDAATMRQQIGQKIEAGFSCLKLKIGAIDFDTELRMIEEVRRDFPADVLEIRVDANGAFNPGDAMRKLNALARYDLHSIEQPLPRDCDEIVNLCRCSPVPVALDEDMIERWWNTEQMHDWLSHIRPDYIVLKPSLVGGFDMAERWIKVATDLDVRWWATSALESNVGLGAIAQWVCRYPESMAIPQGLGTGRIYLNNTPPRTSLIGERLFLKL